MAESDGRNEESFSDGIESAAQEGINGANNAINASKSAIRLADTIKNKGAEKGAAEAAKTAGKAAAKAAGALAKISASNPAVLVILIICVVFMVLGANTANTPPAFSNSIGAKFTGAQEQYEEYLDEDNGPVMAAIKTGWASVKSFFQDCASSVTAWLTNTYYDIVDGEVVSMKTGEKVTQSELDELNSSGEYDDVLEFYIAVTQHYLDLAYQETYDSIVSFANSQSVGGNDVYNASKTISTIGDTPLGDSDYANILAGYSITDSYETGSLSRFKQKLHEANSDSLFLTYKAERRCQTAYRKKIMQVKTEHGYKTKTYYEPYLVYWDDITLIPYDPTEICEIFGEDKNDTYSGSLEEGEGEDETTTITNGQAYEEYYKTISSKMADLGYTTGAYGSVSGSSVGGNMTYGTTLSATEIESYLAGLPSGTSKNRKQIIKTALNLVGRVPYYYGGKYAKYGWNSQWGQASGNSTHPYYGLDCSGFVQWVYRNALCGEDGSNPDSIYKEMGSTASISSSSQFTTISASELQPGDIGLKFKGGSSSSGYNHTGIYLGNGQWIHCSGSGNTVVISSNPGFTIYLRAKTDAMDGSGYWSDDTVLPFMDICSDDDLTVICTTIYREYTSDEGFRACAEAIYNYSRYTGKTMRETIAITNYLDAYTRLYVNHTDDPSDWCPDSNKYKILEDVMAGNLTTFPPSEYQYPVMYFNTVDVSMTGWRSKATEITRIGNVLFFAIPGQTYAGYGK